MNEVFLELCHESVRCRQVAVRKSRNIRREWERMSTARAGAKTLDFYVEKIQSTWQKHGGMWKRTVKTKIGKVSCNKGWEAWGAWAWFTSKSQWKGLRGSGQCWRILTLKVWYLPSIHLSSDYSQRFSFTFLPSVGITLF